jgi:hypothetical protein
MRRKFLAAGFAALMIFGMSGFAFSALPLNRLIAHWSFDEGQGQVVGIVCLDITLTQALLVNADHKQLIRHGCHQVGNLLQKQSPAFGILQYGEWSLGFADVTASQVYSFMVPIAQLQVIDRGKDHFTIVIASKQNQLEDKYGEIAVDLGKRMIAAFIEKGNPPGLAPVLDIAWSVRFWHSGTRSHRFPSSTNDYTAKRAGLQVVARAASALSARGESSVLSSGGAGTCRLSRVTCCRLGRWSLEFGAGARRLQTPTSWMGRILV